MGVIPANKLGQNTLHNVGSTHCSQVGGQVTISTIGVLISGLLEGDLMDNTSREYRSDSIGVFLIDHNRFFRRGVSEALLPHSEEIEILGESDVDEGVLDMIRATIPKVALIDVSPPLLSGIALTRRIAERLPGTLVVLLTYYPDEEELFQATAAGAAAYLGKDICAEELANTIKRVASGELVILESLLAKPRVFGRVLRCFQELSLRGRVVETTNAPITERETEILSYVACGYGNKQIAHALKISEQTIKNHMTSILRKLEASDRTHAVVMAMKYGWISSVEGKDREQTIQSTLVDSSCDTSYVGGNHTNEEFWDTHLRKGL